MPQSTPSLFVKRVNPLHVFDQLIQRITQVLSEGFFDTPLCRARSEDDTERTMALLRAKYLARYTAALADGEEVWVVGFVEDGDASCRDVRDGIGAGSGAGDGIDVVQVMGAAIVAPPGKVNGGRGPFSSDKEKNVSRREYKGMLSSEATAHQSSVIQPALNSLESKIYDAIHLSPTNVYELTTFAITPRAQGKGLGKLLVRELVERAEREGAVIVSDTVTAPEFYAKMGFDTSISVEVKLRRVEGIATWTGLVWPRSKVCQ